MRPPCFANARKVASGRSLNASGNNPRWPKVHTITQKVLPHSGKLRCQKRLVCSRISVAFQSKCYVNFDLILCYTLRSIDLQILLYPFVYNFCFFFHCFYCSWSGLSISSPLPVANVSFSVFVDLSLLQVVSPAIDRSG